jgi:3-deoxy-D-manno-octulosonic-acid transferase
VGGSLVPIGGHNLLEPAALGLPIVAGPHNFNSADIARLLVERGAVTRLMNFIEPLLP